MVAVETSSVSDEVLDMVSNSTQEFDEMLLSQGIGTSPECENLYSAVHYRIQTLVMDAPRVLPLLSRAKDINLSVAASSVIAVDALSSLAALFKNISSRYNRNTSPVPRDLHKEQYDQHIILITSRTFPEYDTNPLTIELGDGDVMLQIISPSSLLFLGRQLMGISKAQPDETGYAQSLSSTFNHLDFPIKNSSFISGSIPAGTRRVAVDSGGSVWSLQGGLAEQVFKVAFSDMSNKIFKRLNRLLQIPLTLRADNTTTTRADNTTTPAPPNVTALPANVLQLVFIVDNSELMGDIVDWMPHLTSRLEHDLNQRITSASVHIQYALVSFANSKSKVVPEQVQLWNGARFVDRYSFEVLTYLLGRNRDTGVQNGYDAVLEALAVLRASRCMDGSGGKALANVTCLKQAVLLTVNDYESSGIALSRQHVLGELQRSNVDLHGILSTTIQSRASDVTQEFGMDARRTVYHETNGQVTRTQPGVGNLGHGYGHTNNDYAELALLSGGSVWNGDILLSKEHTNTAFTEAFSEYLSTHAVERFAGASETTPATSTTPALTEELTTTASIPATDTSQPLVPSVSVTEDPVTIQEEQPVPSGTSKDTPTDIPTLTLLTTESSGSATVTQSSDIFTPDMTQPLSIPETTPSATTSTVTTIATDLTPSSGSSLQTTQYVTATSPVVSSATELPTDSSQLPDHHSYSCADILLVVEESSDMAETHAALPDFLRYLNGELCNSQRIANCGNKFTVVAYGGSVDDELPVRVLETRDRESSVNVHDIQDLVDQLRSPMLNESTAASDTYIAVSSAVREAIFRRWPTANGDITYAYRAMFLFASQPRVLLDPDITASSVQALLREYRVNFHSIVSTPLTVLDILPLLGVVGNTTGYLDGQNGDYVNVPILGPIASDLQSPMVVDYILLTFSLGGSVWNLDEFLSPTAKTAVMSAIAEVITGQQGQDFPECPTYRTTPPPVATATTSEEPTHSFQCVDSGNGLCDRFFIPELIGKQTIAPPPRPLPKPTVRPQQPTRKPVIKGTMERPSPVPITQKTGCNCVCSKTGRGSRFVTNTTSAFDILLVMDESYGMNAEVSYVPGMVEKLNRLFKQKRYGRRGKCPNLFSVVTFGRRDSQYGARLLLGEERQALVEARDFSQLWQQIRIDPYSYEEDGYHALATALRRVPYRRCSDVAHVALLISDEDRDISELGRATDSLDLLEALQRRGFTLAGLVDNPFFAGSAVESAFGVARLGKSRQQAYLNPYAESSSRIIANDFSLSFVTNNRQVSIGTGNDRTQEDYVSLVLDTCGSAWDMTIMRFSTEERKSQLTAAMATDFIRQASDLERKCRCVKDTSGSEGLVVACRMVKNCRKDP